MGRICSSSVGRVCAALLAASSCAWSAVALAGAEHIDMIDCQIQTADRGGALQLDAVVISHEPSQGHYRLEVIKNSSSGSSHNIQDGAFVLEADTSTVLTTVVLDGSAVGRYRATLRITSQSGSMTCVSP